MADSLTAPKAWDEYGNPIQSSAPSASSVTAWDENGNPISAKQKFGVGGMLPGLDHSKAAMSLVNSRVLDLPSSVAYHNDQDIIDQLNSRGLKMASSPADIAKDIKEGLQGSIVGLSYTGKLPSGEKGNIFDETVSGLSQMVADLPFYIGGGLIGAAAGSEAPVVGNVAGGAMGAFAVPASIRKSLVLGIQRGDIKSFTDLLDRTGETILAGAEGAALGLATEASGGATLPLKFLGPTARPLTEAALRKAQSVAALTILSKATEGQLPTASDFTVNAALLTAMHFGIKGVVAATGVAPKVQSRVMDTYSESGVHPAQVAADALWDHEANPGGDPVERVNEIARNARGPVSEAQPVEEAPKEAEGETEQPTAPPTSLRPAVRDEATGNVTPGAEGETHPDIVERSQEGERGFVNRDGEFMTRDQAKAWLRGNEPQVYQEWERVAGNPDEEFHSTDYNEAVRRSTGIKNASVDAQREQEGLPPIESPTRSLDPDNWEQAKADVDSGRIDPLAVAQSINDHPRGLSPEETNALNYYRADLSNQHKAVMDAIEKARADDDPLAEQRGRERLAQVEDKINTVDQATKKAGTEWGLTGRMRQRTVAEDYSLDRVLQRARVASPNGEVSPAIRERLETLTRQLDIANKRLEEAQTKQSQREAQRSVERIQEESKRTQRKSARKQERIELDDEFSGLVKEFDSLIMGRMSANPFFDPEVIGLVGKMAKNRIESGLTRIEDIVDYIHEKLTDLGHDVTKRDIRDAISGYGRTVSMSQDQIKVALREAKRQGQLISALEDAQAKKAPLRSGLQRDKASERVRELQQQVKQAMRESGVDAKPTRSPEEQWRSALDAVKTRLRNQITDLNKRLAGAPKPDPKQPIELDEEAKVLKAERDKLRSQLEAVEGKPGMSPQQKLKMAMKATQKSIDELTRRIDEKDLTPTQRQSGVPETPELKALREQRDSLRETFRQMQEAAKPKLSPEEARLARYKTYIQKRIADMERQLSTGNFNKEPQPKAVLDPEATDLKLKSEKLRRQMDAEIEKQKRANRTTTEKTLGFLNKWRRAVLLTSWHTLSKLQSAAMLRMGVTPVEELIGGIMSKIPGFSGVSRRAPFEGGFNISAEAKAFSQFWQKATAEDTWEAIKSGKTSLDVLYGDKRSVPPMVLDFIGHLHSAFKVIPKRAEFFRRVEKATQWAIDNNLDINDPRVSSAILAESYEYANRAILMQKNAATGAYNAMLGFLHNQGVSGRTLEQIARFTFPIVHVPTNFVAESLQYTPGGAIWSAFSLFKILSDTDKMGRSAMDNLTMHDFDNVMRGLKKGSIGLALFSLGFALRRNVGGYYKENRKRAGEVGLGSVKVGDTEIPAYLLESAALQSFQLGATVGKVWDHYNMKGISGGFVAGSQAAATGLAYGTADIVKQTPFLEEPARLIDALRTPESMNVMLGELAGSMMVPLAADQIARQQDPLAQQRKARTFTDAIKLQVPGLRESVPVGGRSRSSRRSR